MKLEVNTVNLRTAGTKSVIQVMILRDAEILTDFVLDAPPEITLRKDSTKTFELVGPDWLARRNDETQERPPGFFEIPMPYPNYGLEFSHGLSNHLRLRLRNEGPDLWQWGRISLAVKHIRLVNGPFGFKIWKRDSFWTGVSNWVAPEVWVNMSSNPSEGYSLYDLEVSPDNQA